MDGVALYPTDTYFERMRGTIGTRDVEFRKAYEQINSNAFLDETYSTTSKNVLIVPDSSDLN